MSTHDAHSARDERGPRDAPAGVAAARRILGGALAWFAGALLVIMTFLVLFQVFTRYVLNDPAAFTEELVRYALVWTTFVAAAYAFVERKHMALVFVRDRFRPAARRVLVIGSEALVLLFAIVVLVVGGTMLVLSARYDYSALLGISRGLVYAIAPITGLAITAAQVLTLWEEITGAPAAGTPATDVEGTA